MIARILRKIDVFFKKRIFKREVDSSVNWRVFILVVITFAVFLTGAIHIGKWAYDYDFRHTTYEVVEEYATPTVIDSTKIYVYTIPFKGAKLNDFPHIYYFRDRKAKKVDIFLNPQYIGTRVNSERYVDVFHSSHYVAQKGALVYNSMFKLADITSEEKPLLLLESNEIIYGIMDDKAYLIANINEKEVPETVRIGKLRNIKKKYKYEITYNGDYEEIYPAEKWYHKIYRFIFKKKVAYTK